MSCRLQAGAFGLLLAFVLWPAAAGRAQSLSEPNLGLQLPPGFRIEIFAAGLDAPRMMAFSPQGVLFVTVPGRGRVVALPDRGDGKGRAVVFAEGLDRPHGIAFHRGSLYVAETGRILRFEDRDADLEPDGPPAVIVDDIPAGGGHWTRTIAFGPDGKLYVSVGSTCNVCLDAPRRAAILQYEADGSNGRVFARGLRNAVGLAWHPETGRLWVTNNGRDRLGDDLPPETIYIVEDGAHYGWPHCYSHGARIVLDPDFGDPAVCDAALPAAFEMQAHSAPLGIAFYTGEQFPAAYRGDAYVAFHGSWNRSVPTGYKVVRIEVENGRPVGIDDFITGWLVGRRAWGRPVGLAVGPDGALYVSDDRLGVIYRVRFTG
ncbi:MAG TPA: sorbosone dehydrogenase family protein [Limnochordia bacterium]